jgi:hypothetical protein
MLGEDDSLQETKIRKGAKKDKEKNRKVGGPRNEDGKDTCMKKKNTLTHPPFTLYRYSIIGKGTSPSSLPRKMRSANIDFKRGLFSWKLVKQISSLSSTE